jgi:hypothetical protein
VKFSKYNRRKRKHKPTHESAEAFAIKTMLKDQSEGIEMPVSFYESLARKNETGKWEK